MLIGHYEPEIWAQGGVASYIRRISSAQIEQGHKVLFFSRKPSLGSNDEQVPILTETDEDLFLKAQELDLDILHLHKDVNTLPPVSLPTIRTLHTHKPYCPSGGKFLKRRNCPCDRSYSFAGCLWGHFFDHCGSIRPHKIHENFSRTQAEIHTLKHIPVIAVSHFLKKQLIDSGYSPEMIKVLHLFSPNSSSNEPPPQTDISHFVFIGRIVPQKGLKFLLKSLSLIKSPIHLDVAGEGYQLPELKHFAEKLNISDKVTFHGWVNENRVNELIRSSRALVFPSIWHEPGGTVAFEAMVNSRAVVMTKVGGMPEIVLDKKNGLLVEPNNVEQLVESLESLASNWNFATQLGVSGRIMSLQNFTMSNHIKQLMKFYQQAIEAAFRTI